VCVLWDSCGCCALPRSEVSGSVGSGVWVARRVALRSLGDVLSVGLAYAGLRRVLSACLVVCVAVGVRFWLCRRSLCLMVLGLVVARGVLACLFFVVARSSLLC